MFVYFLGLPGIMLTACGLVGLFRRHDRLEMARLLLVPLLFLTLIGSKLWEARQFLPLTPFFLALAVYGFRLIARSDVRSGVVLRSALAAVLAVSLLGPVAVPLQEDGPHALGGRMANVLRWRDWQRGIEGDLALLATLPSRAQESRPLAVVTDQWSEDRYTHLALEEAGYAVQPPPNSACALIAERFVHGPREIFLVRPQQGYVPYWRQLTGERMERFALPCLTAVRASVILVASASRMHPLVGLPKREAPADAWFVPLAMQPLDSSGVDRLIRSYHDDAERDRLSGRPGGTVSQAALATRRRTNFHI
jgi:hypothetical protein